MPSSISNSDITLRDVPDQPWPKLVAGAVVIMLVALASWEMLARSMHYEAGTYDDFAAFWAEERKKLDAPHDYKVVLFGSSRMQWAADLDVMAGAIETKPLQLSIAGTSPALMLKHVVDGTDFDGVMVVGVAPFLFNRLDEGFFGGAALKAYDSNSASKYLGRKIHLFLSDYFAFLDENFGLFTQMEHYNTLPKRAGAEDLMTGGWKLGNIYDNYQTRMWAPIEDVGSFDNQQILNFWSPGLSRPPEGAEKMAEMAKDTIAYFAPLVAEMRARGGDVIFVRMPGAGRYLEHDTKTKYDELTFNVMRDGLDALMINAHDYPALSSELEIPEWSHLSRDSQKKFSRDLFPILEAEYQKKRGVSLQSVIAGEGGGD